MLQRHQIAQTLIPTKFRFKRGKKVTGEPVLCVGVFVHADAQSYGYVSIYMYWFDELLEVPVRTYQ